VRCADFIQDHLGLGNQLEEVEKLLAGIIIAAVKSLYKPNRMNRIGG